MANRFKNASRFSILNENIEPIHKPSENNGFKKSQETEWQTVYNKADRYSTQNRFNYDPEREKQKAKLAKEELTKKNLDVAISFPDLVKNKAPFVKIEEPPKPSFLEKIKIVKPTIESVNDEQQNNILPGWVELSYNKKNKKMEYKYGDRLPKINNNISSELRVLKKLSYNYEKWKADYIQSWGEEEYNKMYISPNYDYHYFDKLDEEYELQQELDNETPSDDIEAYQLM